MRSCCGAGSGPAVTVKFSEMMSSEKALELSAGLNSINSGYCTSAKGVVCVSMGLKRKER